MNTLDLALIGNCTIGALINDRANIVWGCFPRFDGDPHFCALLRNDEDYGYFAIDLAGYQRAEQQYLENTAILITRVFDDRGGGIEITDFAPRFRQFGRMFRPMMLIRRIRRIAGNPRITIRLRPACGDGAKRPEVTWGSNHIRYVAPALTLRLTTDASITALLQETAFFLNDTATLILGADETIHEAPGDVACRFQEETTHYWREWVRFLGIPFEWQDAVIRAAISIKLNAYDDTGAIVAAMTTSITEAANTQRTWDYRYCWLRDSYFVVNALNRLGATRTMERYIDFILNISADSQDGRLQPVFGIDGKSKLEERDAPALVGYRGMGPVRIGNAAYRQVQHDVYGSAILAATHIFFDRRLARRGDHTLFEALEALGHQARQCYDKPDAGIWELRGTPRVHTFSAAMCWAACNRLGRIANRLGLIEQELYWLAQAEEMHANICRRAWSDERGSFVSSFGGDAMDASLLLLNEIGFLEPTDPRFAATVSAVEKDLRRGDYIFRYIEKDDFGFPENAFIVCTFWYVNALAAIGRRQEARELFKVLLDRRNPHGLFAEHIDPQSGEQWGNFVQTYSMVGLINAAIRLSIRWDQAF